MASNKDNAMEIDRLATQLAKDPHSKAFMPLAEEYGKAGMWQEAAAVLEDGLKYYPGFITAMVALGRAYDQMGQAVKAKAVLEEAVKLSPENLRAHRTLVKLYASRGLKDEALKSCAVILAVNPLDEEAHSARAALGVTEKPEPEAKKKSAASRTKSEKAKPTPSVQTQVAAPADEPRSAVEETASKPAEAKPASIHPLDLAAKVEPEPQAEAPTEEPVAVPDNGTSPLKLAADLIEQALQEHDKTGEHPAVEASPLLEYSTPTIDRASTKVVAQLETWLRSIQSRRRDQDHSKAA